MKCSRSGPGDMEVSQMDNDWRKYIADYLTMDLMIIGFSHLNFCIVTVVVSFLRAERFVTLHCGL